MSRERESERRVVAATCTCFDADQNLSGECDITAPRPNDYLDTRLILAPSLRSFFSIAS
jgi:hypothetical protein